MKLFKNWGQWNLVNTKGTIDTTLTIKFFFILIIIGAILGSTAPFAHILFPKNVEEFTELKELYHTDQISKEVYQQEKAILKEKYSFFGFRNKRLFLSAIGQPLALFFCALIMLYISRFINDKIIKRGALIAGASFQFTAIYFITWSFWAYTYEEKDFSKTSYYTVMLLSSIMITITIVQFFKSTITYKYKIATLIDFIVDTRNKLFPHKNKINNSEIQLDKEVFDNDMYSTFEKITK